VETSLHRDLKRIYAGDSGETEVRLAGFRIDAVVDGELVEIQHGSLAAIRRKIARLLEDHRVRVVKPLVARKTLLKRRRRGGRLLERRLSPKRATALDVFDELVHFTDVFPHPRLTLEVPLVEVEEHRRPGHGRRRWRRPGDHVVDDQVLVAVQHVLRLADAGDLVALLPTGLPAQFDTAELAAALGRPRWLAQRIAYCLRRTGAARAVGRRGRAVVHELVVFPSKRGAA
jgi:hypothetical protein